ncbi:MAG: extracellular solute-binding protein [Clostridiales bacterium]|nr:extracellular solute-binding protein [Clostridiales bacterium]
MNIVEGFNNSQDNIHVTMLGGSEDKDEYLQALSSDTVDVYVMPYRFIRNSSISTELYPLTDYFSNEADKYYETIIELVETKKGIMGVPWIGHSMGIVFNKELVNQAEIDPYKWKTTQDLLEACMAVDTMTESKGLGLVGADHHDVTWMLSQFIYTYGGRLMELDENGEMNKVAINSKESIEAIDFYIKKLGKFAQDGWEDDTGLEVMELFASEEIAFEIQGPWAISDIWKRGYPFEIGTISLSQIGMYSEVGPLMLTVSKDSLMIDEAKEFISYLIDEDTLEKIMDGEYDPKHEEYYPFRVPLKKNMENSQFFKQYPEFLVFIEGYKKPSINTPSEEWAEKRKQLYSYYIHEAIIGNITIEEALELIEK